MTGHLGAQPGRAERAGGAAEDVGGGRAGKAAGRAKEPTPGNKSLLTWPITVPNDAWVSTASGVDAYVAQAWLT
jgi:hypothetical protein